MDEFKIAPEFYTQRIEAIAKKSYQLPKKRDKSIIRSNCTCEICNGAGGKFLVCIYCNVVCHYACYISERSQNKNISEYNWVCFHCEESIEYDKNYHRKTVMGKAAQEFANSSQIKVAACWRRYSARKKFKRIYSSIIQLQISFHVKMQKRKFMQSAQKRLRTMKMKINGLSDLLLYFRETHEQSPTTPKSKQAVKKETSVFFIISVQEVEMNEEYEIPMANQTWRIDTSQFLIRTTPHISIDIPIDEKYVLGGVNGFQTVVITAFQRNLINNGRDIFLGQTTIDLSKNSLWKTGGHFDYIPLLDYDVEIMDPSSHRPIKIETSFFDTIKPVFNESTRKFTKSNGRISFEITALNSMNTECCHCYAPALDDFIRELRKSPDQTGFFVPPAINRVQRKAIPSSKRMSIVEDSTDSSTSSVTSLPPISPNLLTRSNSSLSLSPPNSVVTNNTSSTNNVSSNSRTATPSSASYLNFSEHQHQFVMKKVWICIADGKIYFYSHFGDPLKLILDLHYFQIAFDFYFEHDPKASPYGRKKQQKQKPIKGEEDSDEKVKGGNAIYCLYRRTGSPDFKFYPLEEKNIFTLKCALLTSLRASKGNIPIPGLSNINNQLSAANHRFDVNVLARDLLILEDNKAKQLSEPPRYNTGSMKFPGLRLIPTIYNTRINNEFDSDEDDDNDEDDYDLDREHHGVKLFKRKPIKYGRPQQLPPIDRSSSDRFSQKSISVDSAKTSTLSSLPSLSSSSKDGLYPNCSSSFSFSRDLDKQNSIRFTEDDYDNDEFRDELSYSDDISRCNSKLENRSRSSSRHKSPLHKSQSEEMIQTLLTDQLTMEAMIQNEKYQNIGEKFIQSVLNKAADRQIHSNSFRPRLSYSDSVTDD